MSPRREVCACGECRACRRRARYQAMTPEERRRLRDGADPERAKQRERARYYRDREKRLAQHQDWAERNREHVRSEKAKWRAANPEKNRAWARVAWALRTGRLERQPCEQCGVVEGVHAHHDDYSKPLDVRWLCQDHHAEVHRRFGPPEEWSTPWAA